MKPTGPDLRPVPICRPRITGVRTPHRWAWRLECPHILAFGTHTDLTALAEAHLAQQQPPTKPVRHGSSGFITWPVRR